MSHHGPVTDAVNRLQQGEPGAARDLQQALEPFLIEMIRSVRHRIDGPLKPRIDSEAVVYDALKSFLTGIPKGEFEALQDHLDVQKTLTVLIRNTLRDEIRRHRRQRRSPYREQSLAGQERGSPADHPAPAQQLVTEVAVILEKLLGLGRVVHAKAIDIVNLSLQGLDNTAIAAELGLAVRTVQKIKQELLAAYERTVANEV